MISANGIESDLTYLILTISVTIYFSFDFFSFPDFKDIVISLRGRLAERLLNSEALDMLRIAERGGFEPLNGFVGDSIA